MEKIDSELKVLEQRFDEMEENYRREILKQQFAFQGFLSQNVYKKELMEGTIDKYPMVFFEIKEVKISEVDYWSEHEFYMIIDEWSSHVPRMKFASLGNYIFFFKSIFFRDYQLALDLINSEGRMSLEEMRMEMYHLAGLSKEESEIWKLIEKYLCIKGLSNQKIS